MVVAWKSSIMKYKPKIPPETLTNWQKIVDLMARISETPAGLIMRLEPGKRINVFVTSGTEGNAWELGDQCELGSGLYCEEVIKRRDGLLVPDAKRDPKWDHNPDLKFGMSFYLGFPLMWPDGEVFGTICVLDTRENPVAVKYRDLICQFKKVVDGDLRMLVEIAERRQAQAELLQIKKDLERRVEERTRSLRETNQGLRQEIAKRQRAEEKLKRRESELEEKSARLQDVNTALRVLIEDRESAKTELESSMLANINELIVPSLNKLRKSHGEADRNEFIDLIESSLKEITSSFSNQLVQKYTNLTPTEVRVVNLIRQGKKTKEIARCLNTATSTVDFHRANIRRKIGLSDRRTSLHTYFLSGAP